MDGKVVGISTKTEAIRALKPARWQKNLARCEYSHWLRNCCQFVGIDVGVALRKIIFAGSVKAKKMTGNASNINPTAKSVSGNAFDVCALKLPGRSLQAVQALQ
jgi:hypothetical protein